jgi:hypothetical protein
MGMAVMDVGPVRVQMGEGGMLMIMVGDLVDVRGMFMLVMGIMVVAVAVCRGRMGVEMTVLLPIENGHPGEHQPCREQEEKG